MNDKNLDELLVLKKSVSVEFPKSTAAFTQELFAKIHRQPKKKINYWAWAAGFVILLGAVAFTLSLLTMAAKMSEKISFLERRSRLCVSVFEDFKLDK